MAPPWFPVSMLLIKPNTIVLEIDTHKAGVLFCLQRGGQLFLPDF